MNFHVFPDLSQDEVEDIKIVAIRLGIPVKELVRLALVQFIETDKFQNALREE